MDLETIIFLNFYNFVYNYWDFWCKFYHCLTEQIADLKNKRNKYCLFDFLFVISFKLGIIIGREGVKKKLDLSPIL